MKPSKHPQLFTALLTLPILLSSAAQAHPGPIGHTHDDDWPFDPIPFLAGIALMTLGCALFVGLRRTRMLQRSLPS